MTPAWLQELIDELRGQPVCSVETAARALGCGRTLAYEQVRTKGELAGIKILTVGRKRLCPTLPILRLLGYVDAPACSCAKAEDSDGE